MPVQAGVCARVCRHGETMQTNGCQGLTAAFCQITTVGGPKAVQRSEADR